MLGEVLEQSGVNKLLGWHTDEDQESVVHKAWTTATYPFQLALSPIAIKAYLTIFLFLFTSSILLSISSLAFAAFYYTYIPQTDLERPIYLQYAAGTFPRAELPLKTNALISQQPYDISVVLHMPRTPANLGLGNFMVDLTLHGKIDTLEASVLKTLRINDQIPSSTLHHSRRPAMLPYSSTVTNLASTLLHLPLHLVSFKDADSITLTVPMFEELEFARGKDNIPTYIELELQSQIDHSLPSPPPSFPVGFGFPSAASAAPALQVYSAKIVFQVRFHGLRYLIYNYRVPAFVIFTGLFYTTSISTLAVSWALIATFLGRKDSDVTVKSELERKQDPKIKMEQNDTSDRLRSASDYNTTATAGGGAKKADSDRDVPTTFPVLGRNAKPLQYTPQTTSEPSLVDASQAQEGADATVVKQEQSEEVEGNQLDGEHADDEDEDEDESEDEWQQLQRMRERMAREARQRQLQHDSGIGTSMESENASARRASGSGTGLTRRRSQRSNNDNEGEKG